MARRYPHVTGGEIVKIFKKAESFGFSLKPEQLEVRESSGIFHSATTPCSVGYKLDNEEVSSTEVLKNADNLCETCGENIRLQESRLGSVAGFLNLANQGYEHLFGDFIDLNVLIKVYDNFNVRSDPNTSQALVKYAEQVTSHSHQLFHAYEPSAAELKPFYQKLLQDELQVPSFEGPSAWEGDLQASFRNWVNQYQESISGKWTLAVITKNKTTVKGGSEIQFFQRLYRVSGQIFLFPSDIAPWAERQGMRQQIVLQEKPLESVLEALKVIYAPHDRTGAFYRLEAAYQAALVL